MNFDYSLEPGRYLKNRDIELNCDKVQISIITPFFNTKREVFEYTIKSVLNQTYPYFEWIIVDDGSTSKDAKETLEYVASMDKRIKVFHKQNSGLAQTRDYGAKKANINSKYLVFLDDDDEIVDTFLECAYWTLETNTDASWAYSDSLGFGEREYLWRMWYYPLKEKQENQLIALAMIRKKDYLLVGGYEIKEKSVYEDWNFWLKLIKAGKYPIRMNFVAMWYRRKKKSESELERANSNKEKAMKYIRSTSKDIVDVKEGIQYPRVDEKVDELEEKVDEILVPKTSKNEKIKILMIIPWMENGGADKFNYELIKRLNKNKYEFIVVSTLPSTNEKRQKFEEVATVYDLTTFLDKKYWISFINYLIEKNRINIIFNTNSKAGYNFLPYLKSKYKDIKIIDYIHMEEISAIDGDFVKESSKFDSFIDKTLTCNDETKNILINKFNKEEVERVYIGVDENEFNPMNYNKYNVAEELGLNIKDKKVIGYICRITHQKRPELFLKIIKKLNKKRNDLLFIVAGEGELLEKIKRKAKKVGIKNIVFLGWIEEIQKVLSLCDVTVNCSIKEGIALASYESLAMDVPVVSANVGGQKELIDKNVGILIDCNMKEDYKSIKISKKEVNLYAKAIENILHNKDKYKSICREKILNKFTLDRMINNMDKIFGDIIKIDLKSSSVYTYEEKNIINFFNSNKNEYDYLAKKFISENVYRDYNFEKIGEGYEKTYRYKIKHAIYLYLGKTRMYKYIRQFIKKQK